MKFHLQRISDRIRRIGDKTSAGDKITAIGETETMLEEFKKFDALEEKGSLRDSSQIEEPLSEVDEEPTVSVTGRKQTHTWDISP